MSKEEKKLYKWHLKTCKKMREEIKTKELKEYYNLLVIYYKLKLKEKIN